MALLLLTSSDIEENAGATTAQMLKKLLGNQVAADAKINAMIKDNPESTSKSDNLAGCFELTEEMDKRISSLEFLVLQQADKLTKYGKRSRRNNLLIFGNPETPGESVSDLAKAVLDNLFHETLGIDIKSVDRINRLGRLRSAGGQNFRSPTLQRLS